MMNLFVLKSIYPLERSTAFECLWRVLSAVPSDRVLPSGLPSLPLRCSRLIYNAAQSLKQNPSQRAEYLHVILSALLELEV